MYSAWDTGAASPRQKTKISSKKTPSTQKDSSGGGAPLKQKARQFVKPQNSGADLDSSRTNDSFMSKSTSSSSAQKEAYLKASPFLAGVTSLKKPTPTSSKHRQNAVKPKPGKTSLSANASIASVAKLIPKNSIRPVTSPRPSGSSSTPQRQRQPPTSQVKKGECQVCKQVCRSHCAGCKQVFYCSKQHQQSDWPSHKLLCRPFSIPTQYSSGFHLRPPGVSSTPSVSSFNGNNNYNGKTSGVGSQTKMDSGSSSTQAAELQYMISTKQLNPGNIVFTEKPLLLAPNLFLPDVEESTRWCCACFKTVLRNNSNKNEKVNLFCCSKCDLLPLCQNCFKDPIGTSKKFHAGQGHSEEECKFIAEFAATYPESKNPNQSKDASWMSSSSFLKDLVILRVLLFRTLCPWRWDSIMGLRSSPRYIACCKHNFGSFDDWLESDYNVSTHYIKSTMANEKSVQLSDVIKIITVFSETSFHDSSLLALYENLSWIAHACTPNAEQFFRTADTNFEITVKSVETIREGSKIFINYFPSFDGGRSMLALKLFQSTGHFCSDKNCACYQSGFDKTLGIRCDLFPTDDVPNTCSGILSPSVSAPNPEKDNLGLNMFMKSKKWECEKCKKSEKYGVLQSKIMEIAQEISEGCEQCCNNLNKGQQCQSFLQMQSKLLTNLSDQHWMVWEARLRILSTWNSIFGFGPEMLKSAVSFQNGYHSKARDNLMHILKQKVDLYGEGIYSGGRKRRGKATKSISNAKSAGYGGLLQFIGRRHGETSPKRGEMLFDAYFANFILLIEDYKRELPLPLESTLKRSQVAGETCKKLQILHDMLQQTVESLKVCEGICSTTCTMISPMDHSRFLNMAVDSLETLTPICNRIQQVPIAVLGFMNDFLEMYSCQDVNFVNNSLKPSNTKKDPFRCGLEDGLEFETDSCNFGPVSLTFGTSLTSQRSPKGKLSPRLKTNFDYNYYKPKPSRWNKTKPDTEEDDDGDDDNPFIYSRPTPSTNANKTGAGVGNKDSNKRKGKMEDWSNLFFLSSDDDDEDEFDFGFNSSMPNFASDIYDDDALEDLAEWAALQFMMGKMNV